MKNFSLINIINEKNIKESENSILKNDLESEVDEQVGKSVKSLIGQTDDFLHLSKGTQRAFKDMEIAIGLKNNPIKLGNKSLTTADEIFTALKDGSLTSGKELGRIEKGLLKSVNTDPSLRRNIAIEFSKNKNVLDELVKMNRTNTSEIKGYLKSKGYADDSIKEIIGQMKSNGNLDSKGLFIRNSKGASSSVKKSKFGLRKTPTALFNRTKELLNNIKLKKMSWKQLLVWAAGLGIGASALWWFINDNSDTIPEGMPKDEPNPSNDWGPCLGDLVAQKQAQIATTPKGDIVVYVKSTEKYPGGLQFYSNKRVLNIQTKEMGTWTCNNSKATISEIVNKVLSEQINIDVQLNKDVIKMIDLLDFPVTKDNLRDAYNLLLIYAKNGKGKSFLSKYEQSGQGFNTSLSTTIATVYASDPTAVDYKNGIKDLIDKIESGITVKGNTPTNDTNTRRSTVTINEQQSLDIVWDKDKKTGTNPPIKTGDGAIKKGKRKVIGRYKNCEDQDFPLEFGCKSSKIAEVQRCIGVVDDGRLGPNTRKALLDNKYDTSTGLSKDVYNMVMKNCGIEKKSEPSKTEPLTSEPNKTTDSSQTNGGMSDTDYYKSLVDGGYIKGDSRETVLDDGTTIPASERVKYKGPDLDEKSISKLDTILNGMGYDRIKQKLDKNYGDKYVWKKK